MNEGDLMNCTSDNSRVRITKDRNNYKLTLCFNNTCIGDDMPNELDWRISCNDVCEICRSLLGSQSSSMTKINRIISACQQYVTALMHI